MNGRILTALIATTCLAFGPGCTSSSSQQPQASSGGETVFKSPDAAVAALVAALRANDTEELRKIFGPAGDQIIYSGDPVADKLQIERFLAAYDERHRLQTEGGEGGVTTLVTGFDDWPFPVPLVRADGGYVFDAAAGEEEILNRRIGRNELAAEQVCLAIVDAQHEYAETRPMGGDLRQYARKILSDPGQKNGLYWPTADGERSSPLGPLIATASQEGYGGAATRPADASPPPYHGYYFRLLTSQGPHATGGAMDYAVDGRLIGGFGVIAYPATYGNSGVVSFMTNHDGVVYERDLGPDSAKVARSITSFDPGPEWKRSKGHAENPAVQLTSQP